MARIYAEFSCNGQGMERKDSNILAEGARGAVGARFALCDKWDGLNVYAHFQYCETAYDVPLNDGAADVPADVMKTPGFFVSVFGETEEGERLTSERVFVELRPSLDAPGVPTPPLDKTLLQILEAKVQGCIEAAAALRADADAGAFDGAPFSVSHVFGSVAEMEAHEGAEVGAFAVINSGADQEDNARVYQRTADGWLYLADMSGLPGRDGLDGANAGYVGAALDAESDGAGTWVFSVRNTTDVSGLPIPVPVDKGGTGATDAATARANLEAAAADHDHEGVYAKEDHDHEGVYAKSGHTHSLSSLGAAPSSHSHGYEDIKGVAAAMLANQGNAPLVHVLPEYNADAAVTPSGYNVVAYSPATGMLHVNMAFTTTAEVAAGTPLFYLPFEAFNGNSYTSAALATVFGSSAAATLAQAFSVTATVKAIDADGRPGEAFGVGVTLGSKVGAGRRIVIEGALPTHCLWFRHDPVALEARREAVCQAMRDMEGLYTYNNDNAGRLTPETSGYTDCSGTTYTAYKRALAWNIGGVEDYQATKGRHIARFAKGEEIPLWLLQKADLILLYKESGDVWSHAALYMGDNVLWDMSPDTYPNGVKGSGPYLRSDNVSGGLADAWTGHAWSHIDVVRFIV